MGVQDYAIEAMGFEAGLDDIMVVRDQFSAGNFVWTLTELVATIAANKASFTGGGGCRFRGGKVASCDITFEFGADVGFHNSFFVLRSTRTKRGSCEVKRGSGAI